MSTHHNPHFAGYRYPAEVISTALWLCFRFPLSLRMVEEIRAARGIAVSDETVRQWGLKFGCDIANSLRRRVPRRGDKWHLNEAVLTIGGKRHYLWRAVDMVASSLTGWSRAGGMRRGPNGCCESCCRSRGWGHA